MSVDAKDGSVTESGEIWEGVVPGILRGLYVGRRTGRLTFERLGEHRGVHFRGGSIVNADTNVREDRLGAVLSRSGRLSDADRKRAEGFALRDRRRLGAVLIELGLMDRAGLEEGLALHVDAVLSKVFAWTEGRYEFRSYEELPLADELTLRVSTGDLILQAAHSVRDPDVVRYNLGDVDRPLVASSDPLLRFQRVRLSPLDGYVMSRVDGVATAREVIQLVPAAGAEVERSLFGLLSIGVVEYRGERRVAAAATASAASVGAPEPPGVPPPAGGPEPPDGEPIAAAAAAAPVAPEPSAVRDSAVVPAPSEGEPPDAEDAAVPSDDASATLPVDAAEVALALDGAAAAPPVAPEPPGVPDPAAAPAPAEGTPAEAAAAPPTDAAEAASVATPELERTLILDLPSFVEQPPVDPTVILDGPSLDEPPVDPTIVIDAGDLPELPLPERTILLREVPQLTPADLRRLEILNTYQGLKTRNHFEVLGVPRDATEAQVREAYFRLAKRFHPDGQHEADLSGTRDALEAIFRRLGQAYEVLRNPRIRAAYERNLAKVPVSPPADASGPLTGLFEAPEAAIARAAESFAADRLWEVVQILEKAVPRSEGELKQRGRLLLARAYARTPDWAKQGEELLLAVVQQDPACAEAHFHLGTIYRGQGLRGRAVKAFRRVLELEPMHADARRQLAELEDAARQP